MGYNDEFKIFEKKIAKKTKNFKLQNSTFVRTTEKKIQKKFEQNQKLFEGSVAFWNFCPHGLPC